MGIFTKFKNERSMVKNELADMGPGEIPKEVL